MLDSIRASAQSLWVKIAFGVIILVFVFWGVGNFNDRDYSNVVAVVNGEPILSLEFEKAYQNAEEYILRRDPSMTREKLAGMHLGRQVLQELIQATLISQEARKHGIEVTPLELRLAVGENKAFQDNNGKFDPEAYRRVLEGQRLSPAQFEQDLANKLLQDKVGELVTATVWVDPGEALNRYNYLRERRELDYRFIPAAKFMDKVEVSDTEAKNWYESNLKDFAIPPRVDVAYVAVRPELLVNPENIDGERVKKWYEANKSRFEMPERIKAAHILVPVAPDADEKTLEEARKKIGTARAAIAGGKSFAEVADEVNPEGAAGKGGELGWLQRGQTVPEFENAAFALSPGQVSDVTKSQFGLHLVKVEEKQAAGVKSLEDASEEIRKTLAADDGADKLHDVLDNLIEDNILQKPLDTGAAAFGLKAQETGLMDKQQLVEKLGISPEGAQALLATPAGASLDTALDAKDQYIVARVVKSEPESTKPFDEIRADLLTRLKKEKAQAQAMADAAAILEKAKKEPFTRQEAEKLALKMDQIMERGGELPGIISDTAFANAVFATKPGNWLDKVYAAAEQDGPGAILARVDKILPPDESEYENVRAALENALRQERREGIFQLFMRDLASRAKIEVTNPDEVERRSR